MTVEDFIFAARNGYIRDVEQLLAAGADVHANHDSAIQMAAERGHLEVVDCLTEAGADINAENGLVLYRAVASGRFAVVKYLIGAGADIHHDNDLVLEVAAHLYYTDIVKILLESGAALTRFLDANLTKEYQLSLIKEYAKTAHLGMETVMSLGRDDRLTVLYHLHPDLKPKQIREDLTMMQALGLDVAQMAEMWQARHTQPSATVLEIAP